MLLNAKREHEHKVQRRLWAAVVNKGLFPLSPLASALFCDHVPPLFTTLGVAFAILLVAVDSLGRAVAARPLVIFRHLSLIS